MFLPRDQSLSETWTQEVGKGILELSATSSSDGESTALTFGGGDDGGGGNDNRGEDESESIRHQQQQQPAAPAVVTATAAELTSQLWAMESLLSAARESERDLADKLAALRRENMLPTAVTNTNGVAIAGVVDLESGMMMPDPRLVDGGCGYLGMAVARTPAERQSIEISSGLSTESSAGVASDEPRKSMEATATVVEELRSQLDELSSQLEAVVRESSVDKEKLCSDLADARGELAFEVDLKVSLETELSLLRSKLYQKQGQREEKHEGVHGAATVLAAAVSPPVMTVSSLPKAEPSIVPVAAVVTCGVQLAAQSDHQKSQEDNTVFLGRLQSPCQPQEVDAASPQRRSTEPEQDLARAQMEIEELTVNMRNLQSLLDAAERQLENNVHEMAVAAAATAKSVQAAQILADENEESTATGVGAHEQTGLNLWLQGTESRSTLVGRELDSALREDQESLQAAQQAEIEESVARDAPRNNLEDSVAKQAQRELDCRLNVAYEELNTARTKAAHASEQSAASAAVVVKSHAEAAELRSRVSTAEKELADTVEQMKAAGQDADIRLESQVREVGAQAGFESTQLAEVSIERDGLKSSVSGLERRFEAARIAEAEREAQVLVVNETSSRMLEELGMSLAKARDGEAAALTRAVAADTAAAAAINDLANVRLNAKKATQRANEAEAQAKTARAETGDAAAKLSAARVKGEGTEADLAAVRAWAEAGSQQAGASLSAMQSRTKKLQERVGAAEGALGTVRAELEAQTADLAAAAKEAKKALQVAQSEHARIESELRVCLEQAERREKEARGVLKAVRDATHSEAVRLEAERKTQRDVNRAKADAGAEAASRAAATAAEDLVKLQEALGEAQSCERKTRSELTAALIAARSLQTEESTAAASVASEATRLELELDELKDELAHVKATFSAHCSSVTAQGALQTEEFRRRAETAAQEAELVAQAAAAEANRLRTALAEAEAGTAEARSAAQATEERLRIEFEKMTKGVEAQSAKLLAIADREREGAEKVVRDDARAELARISADLNSRLEKMRRKEAAEVTVAQEAAGFRAKESSEVASEVTHLRDMLEALKSREVESLAKLAESRNAETIARAEAAHLETSLAKAKRELAEAHASFEKETFESARATTELQESGQQHAKAFLKQAESTARLEKESAAHASASSFTAKEVRRLEIAVFEAQEVLQKEKIEAEVARSNLFSRLSAAQESLDLSMRRADGLALDLVASSAEVDHLRSLLSVAEAGSEELNRWRDEISRANTNRQQEDQLILGTLREELSQSEAQRQVESEAAREELEGVKRLTQGSLQEAEENLRKAEDLRTKQLMASDRRVSELVAALAAKREDSESRVTTLRSAAGDELERTSRELDASRESDLDASALSERMGRAVAHAARAEAEHERDEAQEELLRAATALESSSGGFEEYELGEGCDGARVSRMLEELAVEIGGKGSDGAGTGGDMVEEASEGVKERETGHLYYYENGDQVDGGGGGGAPPGFLISETVPMIVTAREEELTRRLNDALVALDDAKSQLVDAESRLTDAESRMWDDAEAAWARDVEASREREGELKEAREEAKKGREQAELKLEQAFLELRNRDKEREVCFSVFVLFL